MSLIKKDLGPVRRQRKAGQKFSFVTVRPLGTVVTNGQPFLQGHPYGCYVVPNGRSVYKETVICMGKQNGTVASEQVLSEISQHNAPCEPHVTVLSIGPVEEKSRCLELTDSCGNTVG